jgi:glycosyltransferase involved in cell wall biosynthesis
MNNNNMGKNKVLVVCPVYSPHAGGGGQYFPLVSSQLSSFKNIFNVIVLTERHPLESFHSVENGIDIYRVLPQRDTLENKNKFYYVYSFIWTYILLYILIPYFVIIKRVTIIHYTRYLTRPFYLLTWLMQKILNTKVVLDMRTTVESNSCIEKLFGYDIIISNSLGVFQQMKAIGVDEKKHSLVPNPVNLPKLVGKGDLEKIAPGVKPPFFLFVGQLLERKSISETLEAFALFQKEFSDFSFIVVGRNMLGNSIENRMGTIKNVSYLGALDRGQVLELMVLSEAVLQPSKVEGIPRVTLEALALGKKVLLPPCVPEFIQDNALFSIQSVSIEEIFKALKRIAKTDQLPTYDLSIHHPENSKKFLLDIYSTLLTNR